MSRGGNNCDNSLCMLRLKKQPAHAIVDDSQIASIRQDYEIRKYQILNTRALTESFVHRCILTYIYLAFLPK